MSSDGVHPSMPGALEEPHAETTKAKSSAVMSRGAGGRGSLRSSSAQLPNRCVGICPRRGSQNFHHVSWIASNLRPSPGRWLASSYWRGSHGGGESSLEPSLTHLKSLGAPLLTCSAHHVCQRCRRDFASSTAPWPISCLALSRRCWIACREDAPETRSLHSRFSAMRILVSVLAKRSPEA